MMLHADFAARIAERGAQQGDDRPHASAQRACVLVVDDEPEITRTVAELLASRHEVHVAGSADEALELLAHRPVAVLLTDQRMPHGSGTELLARSLDISPATSRILFTAYSDIAAVIAAVNQGQVFQYVPKPWQPDHLLAVIDEGVERYRLVTENQLLLNRLRRTNEELEESQAELLELLRSISHDVRSPLRALDSFSLLLLQKHRTALDAEGRDSLARIRAASRRLGALLDAQLTLASVRCARLEIEVVDLSALAHAILARLQQSAPRRVVACDVADGLSAETDATLVTLVLDSLISNAWKYTADTEAAHIRFAARARGDTTVYFVEDDGVGFDPRDAESLFSPAGRRPGSPAIAGHGAGLAIVRRALTRLGGRCWAEGRPGRGATFSFTL